MLHYDELKQAVDGGYITGDKVNIVRKEGKVFDFVLPDEPVRPWEVVSEEKVVDVMR
ncbi:competence regulator inhibitor paratox, partial [Streptococcus suis]